MRDNIQEFIQKNDKLPDNEKYLLAAVKASHAKRKYSFALLERDRYKAILIDRLLCSKKSRPPAAELESCYLLNDDYLELAERVIECKYDYDCFYSLAKSLYK